MLIEVELEAPSFLVAVPQLGDPNFFRTVVLMLEHSDEGSMGLVINRPSDLELSTFCDSQKLKFAGDGSQAVRIGGPVQPDRAFILHSGEAVGPETEDVVEGLKLSYSLESLHKLASNPPSELCVYMGYSGWGPGQLADEMSEGAWLLAPANPLLLFGGDPDEVWERVLRDLGIEPGQLMHSGAVH